MYSANGMSAVLFLLIVPSELGTEEGSVGFDKVFAVLPLPALDAADEPVVELGSEVAAFVPPAVPLSVCAAERKAS